MTKEFSLFSLEKLAKMAGVERVSESATKELRAAILEVAEKLAIQAVAMCHHANRVTVKKEDIDLAVRIVFK
jgi:histone H3/H4